MKKLEKFQQSLLKDLKGLGVSEAKAKHLVHGLTIKLRRELKITPLTRPGILIDDKIAAGKGIIIAIKKSKVSKYNPAEILAEYLERAGLTGEWGLQEAFHPNRNVVAWKANRIITAPETKRKEKAIKKSFADLSPEQRAKVIAELQSQMEE